MTDSVPVVLASSSPRRLAILRMLGIEPRLVAPRAAERAYASPEDPVAYALEQAQAKARAALASAGDALVLAADTIVVLEARVLGKPADEQEARAMLRALSGRTHAVVTAVTLAYGGTERSGCERSGVRFRPLADEEIDAYVDTGAPLDKAGAYGIQDRGAALVAGVEGCFYNVMGLPVVRLLDLIARLGLVYDARHGSVERRRARGARSSSA